MKPVRDMSAEELESALDGYCDGWRDARRGKDIIGKLFSGSGMAIVLKEMDTRLRGQAKRERPVLSVVKGGRR